MEFKGGPYDGQTIENVPSGHSYVVKNEALYTVTADTNFQDLPGCPVYYCENGNLHFRYLVGRRPNYEAIIEQYNQLNNELLVKLGPPDLKNGDVSLWKDVPNKRFLVWNGKLSWLNW